MTWLLELVAVAIGVLLALWAQQWVDLRRQRRLEQVYHDSLLDDLRSDLTLLSGLEERLEVFNAAVRRVLDVVEGRSSARDDPDALLRAVTTCFFVEFFQPTTTTTLDELKTTGHLRTLKNRELIRAVLTYHQRVATSYRLQPYWMDRLWKGLWPSLKEHVDPAFFPGAAAEIYEGSDSHLGAPHGEPGTYLKPVASASEGAGSDLGSLHGSTTLRGHLLDALEVHEFLRGELRLYRDLCKETLETRAKHTSSDQL